MLTEEQIKNLKTGDSLVVRGTYIKPYCNGDIIIKCNITAGGKLTPDHKCFHPTCVSIPSEDLKYDPCRKFKKGDKVRVVERNGRSPILCGAVELGGTYTVRTDEDDGDVILDIGYGALGGESIAWTFLELLTPIEELEPYFVQENQNTVEVLSHEDEEVPATVFFKSKHKNARERAEAERDSLNAEHRKEQEK